MKTIILTGYDDRQFHEIAEREEDAGCSVSQMASRAASFMGCTSAMYCPMVCPPRKTSVLAISPATAPIWKERLKKARFCFRSR